MEQFLDAIAIKLKTLETNLGTTQLNTSSCDLNEGRVGGARGVKWDINASVLCRICGEIFASRKGWMTGLSLEVTSQEGVSLRGGLVIVIILFSHCIFCGKECGRKARKMSDLEYGSIAGT